MSTRKYDKPFLLISVLLSLAGIFIFTSASFGLLARSGPSFSGIIFNQVGFGLIGGIIVGYILYRVPIEYIEKAAPFVFIFSLILSLFVFIPNIGMMHGGARRWISIAGISFQPAELLKIAYIVCLAGWFTAVRERISNFRLGLIPFCVLTGLVAILLMAQPDIGTLIIISTSGLAIYFAAGAPWKHLGIIIGGGLLVLILIVAWKPYVRERVLTFLNPSADPYGSSYQIQQSLIAIGSGGLFGKGFGQSVQKYNYLPEPIGDSIFAVLGEEFGLFGTTATIFAFVLFALRGLGIARRSKNHFGRLTVIGIVILIITQSFMNIAAVLGIIPLTGEPLVFISHGGSSLLFALATVGLILNVSRST